MGQSQAPGTIETGTVLIRDGTTLPGGVSVESESFVPGWRLVTDCDGARLDREIHKAGWRYFCLATVIKATAFGKDRQRMIRRTIERILKNSKLEQFNSLEIVEVGGQGAVTPPRLGRVTVSAQPRHIQQSMFLACGTHSGSSRAGSKAIGVEAAENRIEKQEPRPVDRVLPRVVEIRKPADGLFEEIVR
jgi:hypothetical protein